MDSTVIVLIVIIVLLLLGLGAAGVMLSRRRRTERLQQTYGSEYERSVRETGDRRSAEAELTSREKRHEELDIRDLRPEERKEYRNTWSGIQSGFVDDPVQSVHAADRLVDDIMKTRGYPVEDFDRRAEDISVAHPGVVEHYREARSVRDATDRGEVDLDQQRKAVTSYRSLVDALLGDKSADDSHRRTAGRADDRADDAATTDDAVTTDRHRAEDRAVDNGRVDEHRTDTDVRQDVNGHLPDSRYDGTDRAVDAPVDDSRYADDTRPATRPQTEEHTR